MMAFGEDSRVHFGNEITDKWTKDLEERNLRHIKGEQKGKSLSSSILSYHMQDKIVISDQRKHHALILSQISLRKICLSFHMEKDGK